MEYSVAALEDVVLHVSWTAIGASGSIEPRFTSSALRTLWYFSEHDTIDASFCEFSFITIFGLVVDGEFCFEFFES